MTDRKNVIPYIPMHKMTYGEAWEIVKLRLDDDSLPIPPKVTAIEMIARMETLNSITKDELQKALRWLFDHYDF
jgi:hypothetical protein